MSMLLLIDGYNVLHATGIVGSRSGPSSLKRSRVALLNFLADSLDPEEIAHTTVVFDAHSPPPGLPRVVEHRGMTVRFAAKYPDADSLMEELIRAEPAPRRLTVVSSDHRVQRAARRRKARAVDSDVWCAELVHRRLHQREPSSSEPVRPAVPLSEEDVAYWLRQFGAEAADLEGEAREPAGADRGVGQRAGEASPEEPPAPHTSSEKPESLENPFPPGYAEDLLADDPPADPADPFAPGYGEDAER